MLNFGAGERSLIPAIAPPYGDIYMEFLVLGLKILLLAYSAGIWASIPFDFCEKLWVKIIYNMIL